MLLPRQQRLRVPFIAPLSHSGPHIAPKGHSRAAQLLAVDSHTGNQQKQMCETPNPQMLLHEPFPGDLQRKASFPWLLFLYTPQ